MIEAMKNRTTWLLPILLILMAVLVSLLSQLSSGSNRSEPFANRSVYNSGPTGYRAWYLASQKAGVHLETWQKPFSDLSTLPGASTMLMVEPYTVAREQVTFGQQDARQLLSWVGNGNTLVLLDDFQRPGSRYLLKALPLAVSVRRVPKPAESQLQLAACQPWLGNYVTEPVLTRSQRWLHAEDWSAQPARILLKDPRQGPAMVRVPYGRGAVILGTATDLGDNHYLAPGNDNFQLLSNLLRLENKPILVNEFVHGYAAIDDLLAFYQQKTPLGLMFMQLLFAFAFVLWLSFVVWAPRLRPEDLKKQENLSGSGGEMDAFVDSLAGMYQRSHAASLVLTPQLRRIDLLLRRKHRIAPEETVRVQHLLAELSPDYSNKDVRTVELSQAEFSAAALLAALVRSREVAERQEALPHRDLVRLSRQLTVIEERLAPRHARKSSR